MNLQRIYKNYTKIFKKFYLKKIKKVSYPKHTNTPPKSSDLIISL